MVKLPIYDISDYFWLKYRVKEHNVLYENPYTAILFSKKSEFIDNISKSLFVDSNGVIYSVSGCEFLKKTGWLSLLFFICDVKLTFRNTNEKYSIEQFKELLMHRAEETQNKQLEAIVQNADSFEDIFLFFTNV